jgi:hypothetical protein
MAPRKTPDSKKPEMGRGDDQKVVVVMFSL